MILNLEEEGEMFKEYNKGDCSKCCEVLLRTYGKNEQ